VKRGRFSNFTVGLVAIIVITVGCYLGFTKSIPFRPHYEIKAAFKSANGLRPSSPVRVAGIEIGKVSKVEPMKKGGPAAIVTMRINKDGRPIHKDAQMKIRPRIFLEGNFFVDVAPGTPSAPELKDGEMIPMENTAIPVQFDQLLKALPSDTRSDLRGAFAELFRMYSDGGGAAFNRSLEFQPDAYRYSAIVNEALLGRRPGDLSTFIREMGGVSKALNENPERLRSLITNFNRTAGALAAEEGALQRTFVELPRTLRAAEPAFDALNRAFPDVRRLAVEARPGVRSTVPTLNALQPLVGQLRALVRRSELRGLSADLRGTAPSLAQLARSTVPMLGQMRPLASCVNEVIVPWGNDKVADEKFPAKGPVYTEFPKTLPSLSGESRSSDANGQWFKVLGTGGLETVSSLGQGIFGTTGTPLRGTNPPKATRRPPLKPDVPCETQEPPDLRTRPGGPPQRVATNPSSPAARERAAKARAVAIEVMQRQLDKEFGKGRAPKVLDRDATLSDVKPLTEGIVP
jgi:ABC-type transporter Mla subunit MlaD